ncbi:hypothetical protein AGR2A_Cc140029 [Agrobacterium genomosp. 2 str. CFBP 5494]|uniref:Uncharacterized protein n=1 Tax=Agrobacterium genomosp. 2 str. CFBP 5494 TaxID=1183436 RepID=A0A9W5EYA2_9HYPH|nr:hypothetical protein AGR2A_Cc140029 [Agrobacterium genomosp. 2 str. CFBP 5494]
MTGAIIADCTGKIRSFGEKIAVWRYICAELSELSELSPLLNGLSMH